MYSEHLNLHFTTYLLWLARAYVGLSSCRLRVQSLHLGNGQQLIALCGLLLVPVSMPLRILKRCCSVSR